MSAEFFKGAERILSATANGVYQGLLVAILAGLALRFFVRTNAATRHAVWFATLLFVAGLIPAHLLLSLRARPAIQPAGAGSGVVSVVPDSSLAESADQGPIAESDYADWQSGEFGVINIDSLPCVDLGGRGNDSVRTEPASVRQTEGAAKNKGWLVPALAEIGRRARNIETAVSLPHWLCLCLVLAWALFAGARAGLLAGRIHDLRRAKELAEAAGPRLQTMFSRLRDSLVSGRHVELRVSGVHRNAVVLGFAHPVVLLPADMDYEANEAEVEHVLRHELAHIERRDDWSNLTQQAFLAVLFFHPAVWWISSRLSLEREIACDDHVIEASGRPRAYALTLANFAARINRTRHLLAPGVSNNNSHLQQRINMILNTKRDRSPRLARIRLGFFTTVTAILAVLSINALPRLVLAQQPAAASAGGVTASTRGYYPAPPSASLSIVGVAPVGVRPGATATIAVAAEPNPAVIAFAPAAPPGSIAVAGQPGAPIYALAGPDTSAGASWSDGESGPRHKPDISEDNSEPDEPVPPAPPVPALRPNAPISVMPPAGVRAAKRHLSVEERLDRIERSLEELEARGTVRSDRRPEFAYKVLPDGQNFYRVMPDKPGADFAPKRADEARAAADQAQAAAAEMKRAMELGQRAAEKARRDMDKLKSKDLEKLQEELRAAESENSEKALMALRDARESLRSQMQTLEQQIKRLEEDRSKMNKSLRNNRSDDEPSDKPAPEAR
ncbi:MAG TPA: M56 family metallopeptidase [Verrucomicrobiae bacterium]|nr:M56 family metallopeptidase [Verrucomicrobiae bacterium]